MKKTLEFIVKLLVDNPDDVTIAEKIGEDGEVALSISVHKEDMGKIIGKNGKIIQAIRTLMKVLAIKEAKQIHVELLEQPK